MLDSTGRPIYVPDCADATVRRINTFMFEGTLEVLKAISRGTPMPDDRLILDNLDTGKTYEIALHVKEKITIPKQLKETKI